MDTLILVIVLAAAALMVIIPLLLRGRFSAGTAEHETDGKPDNINKRS